MAAPVIRQSTNNGVGNTGSTTIPATLGSAVLAGSRLYAYITWGAASGTVNQVSDTINLTNGWVKIVNSNASEANGPTQSEWWTNPNSAAGAAPTITVTYSVSQTFRAVVFGEITGSDPTEGAAALASAKSIGTATTSMVSNSITTSVANCLVMGSCSNDTNAVAPTAGSGYTLDQTSPNQVTATEWQAQGAAGAITASFTFGTAAAGVVQIVAFKPAPSSAQAPLMLPLMQMAPNGPIGPMALAMRLFRTPSPDAVTAFSLTGDVGALTLTGFAPTLNMTLTGGGVGAATLTGFAPSLTGQATAGVGQVTLSGFAPNATATLGGGLGQATLTGFAPTLRGAVTAGVGQLTASGFAPSFSAQMTAGVGAAILSGFAPTIVFGAQLSVTAGTGLMVLTGYAPTMTLTITTVAGPVEAKWVLLGRQGRRGIGKSR